MVTILLLVVAGCAAQVGTATQTRTRAPAAVERINKRPDPDTPGGLVAWHEESEVKVGQLVGSFGNRAIVLKQIGGR